MLAISAGSDNPRMATNAIIMACLSHPAEMKRAREEIVGICGNAKRLPCFSDLPKLSYMCAVVKEVLHWRPTVFLIPYRVLVEDMTFKDYYFPAGTEFLVNLICVCTDPSTYSNPYSFTPERWLDAKNPTKISDSLNIAQDLWQYTFSAGMRCCSGFKLAQKELFVSWARLLYCFDFKQVGEVDDRNLNPFSFGEPFGVQVNVLGEGYKKLIEDGGD